MLILNMPNHWKDSWFILSSSLTEVQSQFVQTEVQNPFSVNTDRHNLRAKANITYTLNINPTPLKRKKKLLPEELTKYN